MRRSSAVVEPAECPFGSLSTRKVERSGDGPTGLLGAAVSSKVFSEGTMMAVRVKQNKRTLDDRANEVGAKLLEQLVAARRASGWSEEQLALITGVDALTISQMEAGSGTVETLVGAMDALNFQLAGIATGDTLGDQLANRRAMRKLTLEVVSEKTKLPYGTVRSLEEGSGAISDLFRLLALIAPGVRRRAPERAYWGSGKKTDRDSRFTPAEFMKAVYDAFGQVDLDPCAHPMSPVVASRRIILEEGGDGLTDQWSGRLAFVNPPYSKQLDWLKRAHQQWAAGYVDTVLCLVPVRTCNKFFHETLHEDADLFVLRGRLRFSSVRGDVQPTPFSLWIVALGATDEQKARFAELVEGCWFRAGESSTHCDGRDARQGSAVYAMAARDTPVSRAFYRRWARRALRPTPVRRLRMLRRV